MKFEVELTRYPATFVIEAETKVKAIIEARKRFPHSVWTAEAEEIE